MMFSFFKKKNQDSDYFYGLFLKEISGTVFLIEKNHQDVFLKDSIEFFYTNGWENLVDDIDEKLYQLEKKYPEIEVSKTIFFLYSHLIDENLSQIKKPYLNKIKDILKILNLKPLGYIECYEAVSFYLEKDQGIFLNSLILEIDLKQLTVIIFKNGKNILKKTIARTENIIEDIEFCFSSLDFVNKKNFLPGKIIIYGSENLEEIREKIVNYKWKEEYFIQQPKVEIISKEKFFDLLIDVFAKNINFISVENYSQDKNLYQKNQKNNQNSFGFFIGQDIAKEENKNIENNQKSLKRKNIFKINFNFFSGFNLPKIIFSKIGEKNLFIIGFLLIFLGFFINEYFFHQVDLTVYLPTQKIKKQQEFLIDYQTASSEAVLKDSLSTTGKKEVGEKAKGIITLHNFDDKEKNFSKGEIVESSGIKFVLDSDVKVASSTITTDGSAKLPGKANVSITAQEIGPEGNLPKGSKFKIDDLSTNLYFGINSEALTGGTKKTIRVVSRNDFETLEKKVLDKAEKEVFPPKLDSRFSLIKSFTQGKIITSKFSKEVGEEGSSLAFEGKVSMIFYFYDKNDLKTKILDSLKKDLKKNFSLSEENIHYQIKKVEKQEDKLKINLDIQAKGLLSVDIKDLKNHLKGKTINKIKLILKNNYYAEGFDLIHHQPVFIFKNFFPFFDKNIKIKISGLE